MNTEPVEHKSYKPLGDALNSLSESYINFANNKLVKVYIETIDSDFMFVAKDIVDKIRDYINSVDGAERLQNTSLVLNMRLISKMLDELSTIALTEIEKKNNTGSLLNPRVFKLIVDILSCLKNIEVDMFFFNGKFIGKAPADYKNFLTLMESANKEAVGIQERNKESSEILKNMKAVEKAIFQKGLTGAFKSRVNRLTLRVFGLDILNYASLFLIFMMTLGMFVDIDSLSFLKFKNIQIYERFLLITPLVFFSWFVSKRSQFLYQIKEEYMYKYAIGLAYEGYRDEVKDNEKMRERLMDATIDTLSRSPLEQFDKNSDHSPYLQIIKELRLKKE